MEHDDEYTLKYPENAMIYLGYFGLIVFLGLILQTYLNPSKYFQNIYELIIYTLLVGLIGFSLFYFINYRYKKKVIFSQNGVSLKRFLQKKQFIEWSAIQEIDFNIAGFSASDVGTLGSQGILAFAFVPNIGKIGEWNITINVMGKLVKIRLFHVPFSFINPINPIIYENSNLKYLTYQDLKNPKKKEVAWTWKCEGTKEERQETLRFLKNPPSELDK